MNRIASLAALALALASPLAAVAAPVELGFSARLADSGTPVTGTRTFVVKLFDAASGGAALWTETHASTPVTAGVAHLVLGSVTALDDALLNGGPLYVELTVDATTLSPRLEVLSVPYAVRASKAGSALTCTTAETANALGTLTPAQVQQRVSGVCAAGSSIRSIDAAGAVVCEPDDGGSPYIAGFGLTLAGNVFSANTTQLQQRVAGVCAAGTSIRAIDAAGAVTCEADDTAVYTAGSGLALSGSTFSTDNTVVARKDAAAGNQTFDSGTLHLDYTNNRVGVGTTLPGVTLDVAGPARASAFQLSSPRTGKFYIAGNSMTPNLDFQDEEWGISSQGYGYIAGGVAGYYLPLSGAVNVPNGATLTSLFCHYYDNDVSNFLSLTASLYRRALTSPTSTSLASLTSTTSAAGASTAVQTISDTTITSAVIDNVNYHYYFYIDWTAGAIGSNLRLYGCGVTYTYSSLTD